MSVFGKGKGGAKSCQSSADDAGLGFQTTFKLGISGVGIDGAEIIGGRVFFEIGMNHGVMLCVVSDDLWRVVKGRLKSCQTGCVKKTG